MQTINVNQDHRQFRIVVISETELLELIRCGVGMALGDPEIQLTAKLNGLNLDPKPAKYSRQAAAAYLNVSASTLDRIARRQPDILPKRRDDNNQPYFLAEDLDRYQTYRGYPAPGA